MKSYILDIIPKINKFSKRIDDLSNLLNHHWVLFNDSLNHNKTVFVFRENGNLIIANNGIVERSKWEYIGNESLIIETKDQTYLLKHGFVDEKILALKKDGSEEYLIFLNETKAKTEFNSIASIIAFLNRTYVSQHSFINPSNATLGTQSYVSQLKPSEISKVNRLIPLLNEGEVIIKHSVSGNIEIKSEKFYQEWSAYYGKHKIILLARK